MSDKLPAADPRNCGISRVSQLVIQGEEIQLQVRCTNRIGLLLVASSSLAGTPEKVNPTSKTNRLNAPPCKALVPDTDPCGSFARLRFSRRQPISRQISIPASMHTANGKSELWDLYGSVLLDVPFGKHRGVAFS